MIKPDQQPKQEIISAPPVAEKPDVIPAQYKSMPSEVVEELWQNPVYIDAEKNKSETERRQQAIEAIKTGEENREAGKEKQLTERYAGLPDSQKTEFPNAQKDAVRVLNEHIQGQRDIDNLSPEESFVLGKLKTAYEDFKKENPDKPFAFDFSKGIDRKVYNNLSQKLAFKVLEGRQNVGDQEKANAIRTELGVPPQEVKKEGLLLPEEESSSEVQGGGNEAALSKLQQLIEARAVKSRNPQALRELFARMAQENDKAKIAEILVSEINQRKRQADYPINPNYQKAWEQATKDPSLNHKEESGWIYRGNFSTKEKPTITRGSLNITLDENAIRKLDSLIQSGVIDANYKFGEPGTGAEASERHDAVTLYFLTEPTPEAMKALSDVAKKYYRGDDLIGRKISEGFYMSEVGSVSDTHARDLIQQLQGTDQELAKAMKVFLTSNKTGKERVAMSEAQFYSAKEMLNLFGVDINYDKDKGFEILKK